MSDTNHNPAFDRYAGESSPTGSYALKPDSNLVWGILVTVLCCLPFGIMSIVQASKVDGLWMSGHQREAREAAESAKKWAIWGAASAGLLAAGWFALVLIGFLIG